MNSMLRQYHIRFQDLNPYMRGYNPYNHEDSTGTPEYWAGKEIAIFEPGTMMFSLEPVAPPPGLSVTKKENNLADMFRVKDCCALVNYEDQRPLVVAITPNAYELRFLEVLLVEKARKAILDGRDFRYVAVKPSHPLAADTLKELEKLGSLYAQGGSRRSLAVDNSGAEEPAMALLKALGAKIIVSGLGKQVLDIGSICQMIFAPAGPLEDQNKALLKSCFTPITADSEYVDSSATQVQAVEEKAEQELDEFGDPIPAAPEPVQAEASATEPTPSFFENALPETWQGKAQDSELSSDLSDVSWPEFDLSSQPHQETSNELQNWNKDASSKSWPEVPQAPSSFDFPGGSFNWPESTETDLTETTKPAAASPAESIFSFESPDDWSASETKAKSNSENIVELPPPVVPATHLDEAIDSVDKQHEDVIHEDVIHEDVIKEASTPVEEPVVLNIQPQVEPIHIDSNSLSVTSISAPILEPKVDEDIERVAPEGAEETKKPAIAARKASEIRMSASPIVPPSQEPKAMMNEMATLMNKLELQVAKAAKRLSTRAANLKKQVNDQVETIVKDKAQVERESITALTQSASRESKKLDEISEEIHLNVAETSADGRYAVKQLLPYNQEKIDEQKDTVHQSLKGECEQFHSASDSVTSSNKANFLDMVHEHMSTLESLVDSISNKLEQTKTHYSSKFNSRVDRFKERLGDEIAFIGHTLERNVQSMLEEVDSSSDRASEKLKAATADYEQTIHHTVKTAQLNITRSSRRIVNETLIPKLRERREILRAMCVEMTKRFSEESQGQAESQTSGLDGSLITARQQLLTLAHECNTSIENIGNDQQGKLEELFNVTSDHVEQLITRVEKTLSDTQRQIDDSDVFCKNLAETTSVDTDPALTEKRGQLTNKIFDLRQEANTQLQSAIDIKSDHLDDLTQKMQTELHELRTKHTESIKSAKETGLAQLRQAIQDAFAAIQSDREKHME